MRRTVARLALLTAATAALATVVAVSVAVAVPAPTTSASLTCSTNVFDNRSFGTPAGARGAEREPSAWKSPPIEEAPATGHGHGFKATIPVYFHVFTDGTTGNLTNQHVQQQINVLNAGFRGFEGGAYTGFFFKLAGVDRTNNADWFYNLTPNSSAEREAKAATHSCDASRLNIWTTNGPGYLGFATLPSWYRRSPQLDGIVLDYNSFVGGAYGTNFSLGKTATHETATGSACCTPSRAVATTRDERFPQPVVLTASTRARRREPTRSTTTWTTRSTPATTSSRSARRTGCRTSTATSAPTARLRSASSAAFRWEAGR